MFSIRELIDVIIMVLVVGYIFKDVFQKIDKNPFLFACLATAPAIIIHELAHKFVAIAFGLQATFHAAYTWLGIGLILKFINFGFIFFVPAYVSITGNATPVSMASTAFAGPFLNLILFGCSWLLLKQKKLKHNTFALLHATKQINGFLFIFNMLPIPGFDGLKVYIGIYQAIFG